MERGRQGLLRIREGHEEKYKREEESGIAKERPEYGHAGDHADNDRTNGGIVRICQFPKTIPKINHHLRSPSVGPGHITRNETA
jgi:hypothetical protein